MGFVTSSDGAFLKTSDGNFIVTSDTSFLTLGCVTGTGSVGVAYSSAISSNGTGPYTSAVVNGALPTSLSLTSATRIIAGTPTVAGTFSFDIQVFDSLGASNIISCSIVITNAPAPGSGIYKLIPGQTHDELFTTAPSTVNVKIPNPFVETALLGDE